MESTLDFLVSYVAKHFGDEEKLQVQTSYPGYAAHRQFHEWYKGELAGAARDIKTQGASIAALNSLNQMVGKLLMHIRTDDRKAVSYTHLDVYKRQHFYRLIEQFYPKVRVLSFNEVANNVQIQSIGSLKLEGPGLQDG